MLTPHTRPTLLNLEILACLVMLLTGCERESQHVSGFVLPSGDSERGKATFIDLGCRQCHHVAGVALPDHAGPMRFEITLGGEVMKVRRYGDLLNSIIYPNHELAEQYRESLQDGGNAAISPMPDFSNVMTVRQLIDVVEFLHGQYRLTLPEYEGVVLGP